LHLRLADAVKLIKEVMKSAAPSSSGGGNALYAFSDNELAVKLFRLAVVRR
jgi:hypothetical protein